MNLDEPCSQHFTYRQLIECGDTFTETDTINLPRQEASWQALSELAVHILDPVLTRYGELQLTYGFCSPELAKARNRYAKSLNLLPAIYPSSDQHGSYEVNGKGERICQRGGAACDFYVPKVSSLNVALWVANQLPFDRMYFYGADRPLHVSYTSHRGVQEVTIMKPKTSGRGYIPSTCTAAKFLERFADES